MHWWFAAQFFALILLWTMDHDYEHQGQTTTPARKSKWLKRGRPDVAPGRAHTTSGR